MAHGGYEYRKQRERKKPHFFTHKLERIEIFRMIVIVKVPESIVSLDLLTKEVNASMKRFDDQEEMSLNVGGRLLLLNEGEELLSDTSGDGIEEGGVPRRPSTVELFARYVDGEGERDTSIVGVHVSNDGDD